MVDWFLCSPYLVYLKCLIEHASFSHSHKHLFSCNQLLDVNVTFIHIYTLNPLESNLEFSILRWHTEWSGPGSNHRLLIR